MPKVRSKIILLPLLGFLLVACAGHEPVPRSGIERPVRPPKQTTATVTREHRCLALNLYWEARGEGRAGMVAVGWTVLNRVRSKHFPSTPCAVVYQGGEQPPCQFSWWCDGRSDRPRNQHSWTQAQVVAAQLLTTPSRDPTGGALFYHSSSIKVPWKRKRTRTARIGQHIFYR